MKNKEMEHVTMSSSGRQLLSPGGGVSDNSVADEAIVMLHNKWRTVWRLSVERKKLLQDIFDHLLEVRQFVGIVRLVCIVVFCPFPCAPSELLNAAAC